MRNSKKNFLGLNPYSTVAADARYLHECCDVLKRCGHDDPEIFSRHRDSVVRSGIALSKRALFLSERNNELKKINEKLLAENKVLRRRAIRLSTRLFTLWLKIKTFFANYF